MRLDQDTIAKVERRDKEVDRGWTPPPAVIAARREELAQRADAIRNGFHAPIIVRGEVVAYAVIRTRRIVTCIEVSS